jgi:hypothetical protein
MSEVSPCPHCGARPAVEPGDNPRHTILAHEIYNLQEETESIFRKSVTGDTWHFSPNCSSWPVDDYLVLEVPPSVGEFCNECEASLRTSGN